MNRQQYLKKWRKANKKRLKTYASKYYKTYYEKNKVKAIKSARNWALKNSDRVRHNQYMNKYGISYIDFLEMVAKQNNLCAICGKPETKLDKKGTIVPLVVDHCHVTNKVRGLLCDNCNKGLGFFKDLEHNLLKAISYLKKDVV